MVAHSEFEKLRPTDFKIKMTDCSWQVCLGSWLSSIDLSTFQLILSNFSDRDLQNSPLKYKAITKNLEWRSVCCTFCSFSNTQSHKHWRCHILLLLCRRPCNRWSRRYYVYELYVSLCMPQWTDWLPFIKMWQNADVHVHKEVFSDQLAIVF